jgi:two-component system KDP operon response regulator KdpE
MGLVAKVSVDAILLDLDLPHPGQRPFVHALRAAAAAPILGMLPAASVARTVEALDNGADDCVTKPFSLGEVLARIRRLLRHAARMGGSVIAFSAGGLDIDLVQRQAHLHGRALMLSEREFEVLRLLVKADGAVLSYQHLLEQIWGPGSGHRVQDLRRTITHLRRKIEPDPRTPVYIMNDMFVGYRLVRGNASVAASDTMAG